MAKQRQAQQSRIAKASSIDREEVAAFETQAASWWDENGPFRPLHRLNPVRMGYIERQAAAQWGSRDSFKKRTALDIGCGGGLVTEGLAQLGFQSTGIDAGETAITVARAHARAAKLKIDYRCQTVEDLADADEGQFDLVTALEIVEHVSDVPAFLAAAARLLKPGGLAIVSTLNRTPKSFALGIIAAEYILRWVPQGTHDWRKFLRPAELAAYLEEAGLKTIDATGLVFRPFANAFALSAHDLSVNYLLTAKAARDERSH